MFGKEKFSLTWVTNSLCIVFAVAKDNFGLQATFQVYYKKECDNMNFVTQYDKTNRNTSES